MAVMGIANSQADGLNKRLNQREWLIALFFYIFTVDRLEVHGDVQGETEHSIM